MQQMQHGSHLFAQFADVLPHFLRLCQQARTHLGPILESREVKKRKMHIFITMHTLL